MKKVVLSLVAVAFVGAFALTSCKSSTSEVSDSAAPVIEEPAPAPVDTAAADTAAADTAAAAATK